MKSKKELWKFMEIITQKTGLTIYKVNYRILRVSVIMEEQYPPDAEENQFVNIAKDWIASLEKGETFIDPEFDWEAEEAKAIVAEMRYLKESTEDKNASEYAIHEVAEHIIWEANNLCEDYNAYFDTNLSANVFRKAARIRILKEMGIIVV